MANNARRCQFGLEFACAFGASSHRPPHSPHNRRSTLTRYPSITLTALAPCTVSQAVTGTKKGAEAPLGGGLLVQATGAPGLVDFSGPQRTISAEREGCGAGIKGALPGHILNFCPPPWADWHRRCAVHRDAINISAMIMLGRCANVHTNGYFVHCYYPSGDRTDGMPARVVLVQATSSPLT